MLGKHEAEMRELKLMAQLYAENGDNERSAQALEWIRKLAHDEYGEADPEYQDPPHQKPDQKRPS